MKDELKIIDMVKNKEGIYITREEFDILHPKNTFLEEAIGEGILGRLYRFFNKDIVFGEDKSSGVSEADKRRYG